MVEERGQEQVTAAACICPLLQVVKLGGWNVKGAAVVRASNKRSVKLLVSKIGGYLNNVGYVGSIE